MKKRKKKEPQNRYPGLVGNAWVDKGREVVLELGDRTWTQVEMAKDFDCTNFRAARDRVTPMLKSMGLTTARQIYGVHCDVFWAKNGIHNASMYVLACIMIAELNPERYDVMRWVDGLTGDLSLMTSMRRREAIERKMRVDRQIRRAGAKGPKKLLRFPRSVSA